MVREQQNHEKWDPERFFDTNFDPILPDDKEMEREGFSEAMAVTDEQLAESIKEILSNSERIDAHDIHLRVDNHNVTLTGVVEDQEAKEEVENMVKLIEGVGDIRNQLSVEYGPLSS